MDDPYAELLANARPLFRAFYSIATPGDSKHLDLLIAAYVTLRQATSIPRDLIPADERTNVELQCNEVERRFMIACECVRNCATFQKLVPGEQRRLKAVLFDFTGPTG